MRWKKFLPISMPTTATLALIFSDMTCSSSLAPLASFDRWRGRSTAGPSVRRKMSWRTLLVLLAFLPYIYSLYIIGVFGLCTIFEGVIGAFSLWSMIAGFFGFLLDFI